MSRAYWALAQVSRSLARATSEQDLVRQLCRTLVQVGEYHMAWVGYAVHDAECTVRPVAQAGFSEGYVESIRVTWDESPLGRGPSGTAIRTGKPVVIRNARTDPSFAPWREQAIERGFASVIGLPITLPSGVIGALMVYSAREDAFDPEEEELLLRLTEDVAFGIGAMRDRAERERAEEAVAASEQLFRTAFEEASVGKALTGLDGRYLRVNRAFCQMLGYTREELLRLSYVDPTHPEDRAASEDAHRRLVSGELSTIRLEKRYLRKDGGQVLAEITLSLVRSPDGTPRIIVTDVQDITSRRRAEDQLHQSQRMEALALLAGGIAHDFNDLLTIMLAASGFALAQAPAKGQLHDDIEEFRAAAEKARVVTRQLLAFGRRQLLEPRPIDMARTLAEVGRVLRRVVGERIDLRIVHPPALPPILADPVQLEQLILNLAVNARDAMPRGGALTLEASRVVEPPQVALSVTDTGAGMDVKTRSRIFEPFFTTKPVGEGTGLGLSTVAAIVDRAGGSIRVESAPGKGTRFEIRFPVLADGKVPLPRLPSAGDPGRPAGQVVVVVDDDEHLRRMTVRVLRSAGFDVLAGGNLDEALDAVAHHPRPPSVLLTDVRMPDGSGPEVSAELTARVPGLRTVYMSGYATEELADEETFPAGTAFIQKPFTPEALVGRILEALRG